MAEFDAAIALLGLVDPKDEKSSDSDTASGNDQDKTENKRSNKGTRNNKDSSNDDTKEKVNTPKTDKSKKSKPEASNSDTMKESKQEADNCKKQDGSANGTCEGTSEAAELKATTSPKDRSPSQPQPSPSGPGTQHEEQTPQQSSQGPSSEWDRPPQEQHCLSPDYTQQPPQQAGPYQPGQSYQHQQVPAGQQQQQQSPFNYSPQQQQQHVPHTQYQYSAQNQGLPQSQQSQPQSPPQYSQTSAYSTQQSSSNPPPRLPPISQISQPPAPSHHQAYQEHSSRTGYQDHAPYPPYQQHATGHPSRSYHQAEQHPPGYAPPPQHGQLYPHIPPGQHPNIGGRPSPYYSYRDPSEQYSSAGAPGSTPTPQNGYQQYSAPIDPALGGHSVPPVQPQPEAYPKERYYQPPIQPNAVPTAQRQRNTPSNPQVAMNSSVWNAIVNSGGENISNVISALYTNGRNHTHANSATDDFLEAIICSNILGCDTGYVDRRHSLY
ncbi:hypothetical protein V1505DRAFT_316661 [Lipomyces doorenjongii]